VKSIFVLLLLFSVFSARAQNDSADAQLKEHLHRASAAIAAGKYDQALKELKEANKEQSNQCDVCYLEMANVYSRAGDIQHVLETAQKAAAAASSDAMRAQAHAMEGQALARLAASDAKKLHASEQEFRSAVQLDPQRAIYHLNLGVILLKESQDVEGMQELNKSLELEPNSAFADTARKMIANPRRARENYAPDFQLTTLQGENISLNQLAGKIVVLDFWATWCPPCRDSVGDLKELEKKYSPDQLTLVSISADDNENSWREFIAKKQMNWPQFWDRDGAVRGAFGVNAFPTYIVINEEGVITQTIVGEDPRQTVVWRLKSALASNSKLNAKK
jgi:peroxiredoxin/Tfp pilus assembly protein PilF